MKGKYGIWRHVDGIGPELAREVEALGFSTLWVGDSPTLDAVENLLAATTTLQIATGVVNIWAGDATSVSGGFHRIESRYPGRFLLGIGVGHPEFDREYRTPLRAMTEYLDELDRNGIPRHRRILAGLAPKTIQLAAHRTVGVHPYLTTPAHTRWARALVGRGVLLAPEQRVVITGDPVTELAIARQLVAGYLRMSSYVRNLLRLGYLPDDVTPPGSPRLIDDLVLRGTPVSVAAGLAAHLTAGADHVAIQALPQDNTDPLPTYQALAGVLFSD